MIEDTDITELSAANLLEHASSCHRVIRALRDQVHGQFRHMCDLQNAARGTDERYSSGYAQREALQAIADMRAVIENPIP
jgi:hypothetical protein